MSDDKSDDLRLTIPVPCHIPRNRGIYAVTKFKHPVPVRTTEHESQQIIRAAALCGTSLSGFFRWCAVYAAKEILKEENNGNGRNTDGKNPTSTSK